jgi:alpha-beta hydrolase superfamily lysophospholipase
MTDADTPDGPTSRTAESRRKQLDALRRAIPVTRMVDYGVLLGDALAIHTQATLEDAPPWDRLCEGAAQGHLDRADAADRLHHGVTAREARHAASALLQCAQLAFNEDSPRKLALYERAHTAMAQAAQGTGQMEALVVATPAGELHGWVVRPIQAPPAAAVLLIGGLSGWGSVYLGMALALAARGVMAVLGEGPGQGLTRMRSGIHLDRSSLALFQALLDGPAAACGGRVGVWGNSFGGLFAAHLAVRDSRVKAVCINGAPFAPTVPSFRTAREQMTALLGANDEDLAEKLGFLALSSDRHHTEAAMLIVEGGQDPLLPPGSQQAFLTLARSENARCVSWSDGEHTIYNHAAARNALVADWFADRLCEPT